MLSVTYQQNKKQLGVPYKIEGYKLRWMSYQEHGWSDEWKIVHRDDTDKPVLTANGKTVLCAKKI
jgi:hypothetical protein